MATPIYMSSRRTICDGEVVTFATGFEPHNGPFGGHDAKGPFEVSASREGVMVHAAYCRSSEASAALAEAVRMAERARASLTDTWRGGCPSKYPAEPTLCEPSNAGNNLRESRRDERQVD